MTDRALRHPNGGALKIGTEVHVSPDSFCDAESRIDKESEIFSSTIARSRICNGKVFNSRVQGSMVWHSTIAESTCSALDLRGAILHRVTAASAVLSGTLLTLIDVVAENCEIYGNWSLEGNARIPTGIWHRAPRYRRITGENGVDIGLTESTEGYALMACWRKPITKWIHAGPRLGRLHGWTGEQIRAAKEFYEEIGDIPLEGVRA